MLLFDKTATNIANLREPQTYADTLQWAGELSNVSDDLWRVVRFIADIQDPVVRERHARDFHATLNKEVDSLVKCAAGIKEDQDEDLTACMHQKWE